MNLLENPSWWRWFLAGYFALLALIGFWPSPVDQPVQGTLADVLSYLYAHGIPRWFGYRFVEASANVLLFVPVGFAVVLSFRDNKFWQNAGVGILASCCVELGQFLFLNNRFASVLDLVTNTAGTVIGIYTARGLLRVRALQQAKQRP